MEKYWLKKKDIIKTVLLIPITKSSYGAYGDPQTIV